MSASIEYSDNKTAQWYLTLQQWIDNNRDKSSEYNTNHLVLKRTSDMTEDELICVNGMVDGQHILWNQATPEERQLIVMSFVCGVKRILDELQTGDV